MKRAIFISLASVALLLSACSRESKRPNILFLMLDTLRADHMSGYGYERATSPELDRFASENLKASFAITAAPWTPASVASMLTGMYPTSHRMMPPNDRILAKKGLARLSDNLETLPEILKQRGYITAGVSPNPWITKEFGYTQGFDQFHFIERQPADKITESGREILETWSKQKSQSPFFLYLHFLDPHEPYEPPPGFDKKFTGTLQHSAFTYSEVMQQNLNFYDDEINFLDTELGKFFTYLKEHKLYDDLIIVVVSDHGEQFMEHGDEHHGFKLFNEEVHIPLFIKTGRAQDKGRVIQETVSTVDILPTLLDLLGENVPATLPGVSLINEGAVSSRRGVLSEIRRVYDLKSVTNLPGNRLIMEVPYNPKEPDPMKSLEAWLTPKIIGLFDSKKDYACRVTLDNKGLEARMRGNFDELHSTAVKNMTTASKGGEEIKDETLEQLKSLGYLQ